MKLNHKDKFKNFLQKEYIDEGNIKVSDINIALPVKYTNLEAYMFFFPCYLDKVFSMIDSNRISPVKLGLNRGVLGITIFDYLECPVGPYREVALSVPVLLDSKLNIPLMPLVFESILKNFGFFTILLAMDTQLGIQHSKEVFGYNTFPSVLDIDIIKDDGFVRSNVKHKNDHILSFEMKIKNKFKYRERDYHTFIKDGNDINDVKMNIASLVASSIMPKSFTVNFGNHQISNILNNLLTSNNPLEVLHYKKAIEILHKPSLI